MRSEGNDSPLTSGRVLGDRCRELWLPMWVRTSPENALVEPDDWGAAETVLRAPRLLELVTAASEAWPVTAPPPVTELARGCWLISIPGVDVDPDGDGQARMTAAAMALGAEFLDTTVFGEVSRSAQLDPDEARTALAPLCRHRRPQAEAYARVLSWMAADLGATSDQRVALADFSEQLVDMYEQMHLLYRIGELMSGLNDPSEFVRMACELLHTTLEFEWISVRFTSLVSLGPSMTNDLILAGKPSCSLTRYDRLAGEVAATAKADDRPAVFAPRDSELATLVRSEVFVNPLACDDQVAGVLLAGNKTSPEPGISTVDMQLLSATADYLSAYLHNAAMYQEQQATFLGIIKALSAAIDAKDPYTRGHSERVAQVAAQIAVALGMSEEQTKRVRLAGILHDLGKIGTREAVLLKPGRLTADEYDEIKQHPTIGYNILKGIEPLQDVLPGVLHHHERWDGGGYPHGLRGDKIPLLGRILAVADAFDAMSSDRAYRPRMPREVVLREMQTGAGGQWDANLIHIFLKLDLAQYDAMIHVHASQTKEAA